MKLTGKPIYPAELAPTTKVTAAETAIAKLDTDYKAADKTLGDKNTTQDTAIAKLSDLFYESANAPNFDLPNWRIWHQTAIQGANRRSQLYYRVIEANDAILLHDVTYPTA
ncbi:MAG: hypothetical protein ACRC62_39865 [Microcoleus sp.]